MLREERLFTVEDDLEVSAMPITIDVTGTFKHIEDFFDRVKRAAYMKYLERYGERGVEALRNATPVETGKTAASWTYEVKDDGSIFSIIWSNTNINNGVNIAIILDTGHGTGTGGYIVGRHYIDPAIQPVFDEIADEVWKEVTRT